MKIGVFNQSIMYKMGGTESYTAFLVEKLQKKYQGSTIFIIGEYCKESGYHSSDIVVENLNKSFGTKIQKAGIQLVELKRNKNFYLYLLNFYNESKKYDLFFNSSVNMLIPGGRENISITHFPDKLYSQTNLAKRNKILAFIASLVDKKLTKTYSVFLCNSEYTAGWLKKRWNVSDSKIKVLNPPVKMIGSKLDKMNRILVCSRIEKSKRIANLIEAYKQICYLGYELIISGACNDEAENEYLSFLKDIIQKENLNVNFCLNPSRSDLESIFRSSKIFWHAKGYGIDEEENPYLLEHFGITTVEAMSAGVVPVVINKGGQKEIVDEGVNGFRWDTIEELAAKTKKLIESENMLQDMSIKAEEKAKNYSVDSFERKLGEYLI